MATLKDIIDEIYIESRQDASEFRNTNRFMINKYAHDVLKKLGLTLWKNTIGWTLKVPSKLWVSKPQDFEMFIRAYLLDCNGKTIEISTNPKVPDEIRNYLLDCDGSITADECQDIYDDCIKCNESNRDECGECCGTGKCVNPYLDKLYGDAYRLKDSYVKEKADGFEFSHDLEGMALMIEYIGNGISASEPCELKVDPTFEEPIEYYIKFKLLEASDGMFQKAMYYKQEYTKKKRLISIADNPLTLSDLEFISYLKNL